MRSSRHVPPPPAIAPSAFRAAALTLLLWTVPVGSAGLSYAGTLEEADQAYYAGDHPAALELYEEVLEGEPAQMRALVRSALLLAWLDRLDEALVRFDRALAVDPGDRDALLGRARALSWDDRLEQAVAAYRELLAVRPEDAEVRRGLALTLAWNEEYATSREHYARLLERDAGDIDAMVGTARTWAWAGELDRARDWYGRALALEPGNKDAALGLGYVEFWSGDLPAATARARELKSRFPDDEETGEYYARVRQARAPWVQGRVERVDDTDDNRLDTFRVSGGMLLPGGEELSFGLARYDMSDPLGDAAIDSIYGIFDMRPGRGQQLTFKLGLDRREKTDGDRSSDLLGGAWYGWGLERRWQIRARALRDAIRYSPTITDNEILVDELGASGNATYATRWRVDVTAATASLSDDNSRISSGAGFSYRIPLSRPRLEAGYRFRWLDYDEDLDSGYFDPQDFTSHLLQLRLNGEFGSRRHSYGVALDWGVQSFEAGGVDVTDDTVLIVTGTLGLMITRELALELFVNTSNYAVQTASGFESDRLGLQLRWKNR